ncbi:unnamed protein product [Acanthoscelides obtectus]|uniref:Uncharacterized protein n=1 Tax=Acanthoscelides obtectus TaxID=200917 RepID=A0A9P0M3G0_ACAOB|nr:unnamed protein product [Acanthoscelides obtectus]CAK1665102.1 hypothetical protein AOBTE_LOCUS24657 [Acanthoscelides obtectus]
MIRTLTMRIIHFSSLVNNRLRNGSLALPEMFAEQMLMKMQTNSFRTHSEHFCRFLAACPGICVHNLSKILVVHDFWSR